MGRPLASRLAVSAAIPVSLSLALALEVSLPFSAIAKNKAVEVIKYFNPVPEKNYVNESQDRLIKKQNFKTGKMPVLPAVRNAEVGFFAILPQDKLSDVDFAEKLLSKEYVNGLSVLIPWKDLNPREDEFNWDNLDRLLKVCADKDKTLILRVSTCGVDYNSQSTEANPDSDTPDYVLKNNVKTIKYLGADQKPHLMPVFWDSNYTAAFAEFVNELGNRYDKNPYIHSVGITGGGVNGGTLIVPQHLVKGKDSKSVDPNAVKTSADEIIEVFTKEHGLNQKHIVDHWKYVADIFPKAFPTARLNFAINPPTPNRKGEDALDQISDYLVYRYGQRIFITRQNLQDGKHGFDDWRVLIKFRADTYVGLQLEPTVGAEDLEKISKTALNDGVTFIEMPASILLSEDEAIKKPLSTLAKHLGYQVVSQKVELAKEVKQGEPLNAEFVFLNLGAAKAMRPVRQLDKDVPASYRVMVELKDQSGKPVAQLLHTPEPDTLTWKGGMPVVWKESLKMPNLAPGEYEATISLYDPEKRRKLQVLDARNGDQSVRAAFSLPAGTVKVLAESQSQVRATSAKDEPTTR